MSRRRMMDFFVTPYGGNPVEINLLRMPILLHDFLAKTKSRNHLSIDITLLIYAKLKCSIKSANKNSLTSAFNSYKCQWFVDLRQSVSIVNHLADSTRFSWQMWHVKLELAVAAISGSLMVNVAFHCDKLRERTTFSSLVLLFRVVPVRRETFLLFPVLSASTHFPSSIISRFFTFNLLWIFVSLRGIQLIIIKYKTISW